MKILEKLYTYESLYDVDQDIHESIAEKLPHEFTGSIKVTIEFINPFKEKKNEHNDSTRSL